MSALITTDILFQLYKQISNFWNFEDNLEAYLPEVENRLSQCFNACGNKYYFNEHICIFSPLHSVQYSIFLYFLANTIYKHGGSSDTCTKLYLLNKIMNSVDLYYEISLPDVFCAEHHLGSIMGRAKYSNKLFFYQNCTVGGSNGKYPVIGENVTLYSNVSILGDSLIGDNVIFGAGSQVIDCKIPSNCLVFGQSPSIKIVQKPKDYILEKTSRFWR